MNKKILLLILLLFFSNFISALKISPTQENLEINQYSTGCTDIWILPHEDFIISSKWTTEGPGEISNYVLTPENINLEINYSYVSNGKYEFCFTPKQGGNFHGIIHFYSEKTMIEIGSWIDLEVRELYSIQKISLLTGKAIQEIRENNYDLGFVFISLTIIFIAILINLFRQSRA